MLIALPKERDVGADRRRDQLVPIGGAAAVAEPVAPFVTAATRRTRALVLRSRT
jgi:hypothetical protein